MINKIFTFLLLFIPITVLTGVISIEINLFKYFIYLLITALISTIVILVHYCPSNYLFNSSNYKFTSLVPLIIIISAILISFLFHSESLDGGRDPGCYSLGAIELAKTGQLETNKKYF